MQRLRHCAVDLPVWPPVVGVVTAFKSHGAEEALLVSVHNASAAPAAPVNGLRALSLAPRWIHDQVGCLIDLMSLNREYIPFRLTLRRRQRGRWFMFALGPEANRQVLGHPEIYRPMGQVLRGPAESSQRRLRFGLTRMYGAKHRAHRKLLMPPLQRPAVASYVPTIVELLQKELDQQPIGRVIDVAALSRKMMMQVSSRVLFGGDQPERSGRMSQLIHYWLKQNFKLLTFALPLRVPGTPYNRLLKTAWMLEGEVNAMIDAKRRSRCPVNHDILSVLVRACDSGTPQIEPADLVGQAVVLFAASFETSENALAWTLLLLAQHPSLALELLEEVQSLLRNAPPTFELLDRMPLLEAVIEESLRILPPVPSNLRVVTEPATLGGYDLARGDRVICSHYVTHHLARLWPEPESFRPSRWLEQRPGPFDYLPFSAGPRFCIGYFFAMTVLKASVAMILQRYRFSLVPNSRVDRVVRVTLRPKRGLPMIFAAQDGRFRSVRLRGQIHEMVRFPGSDEHPRSG